MLLADLIRFFDQFAPGHLAEEWDNVGLLVGDPAAEIERVLTCLTLTPDVAEEAVANENDVIVTHHPILFRPVQRITSQSSEGSILLKLIQAGVAVYSPHTRYDNAADGVNTQIADKLEIQHLQPLKPVVADTATGSDMEPGAGRFGSLPSQRILAELISMIKERFEIETVGVIGDQSRSVQTVGIACGSAAGFMTDAQRVGCDLFITGEARFHDCLAARTMGLAMILLGHYASERFAMEHLADILSEAFPQLIIKASSQESDPLQWL